MKVTGLVVPHPNVRYRQSLMTLTRVEVQMALDALGRETRVTEKTLGGKPAVSFEVDRLTRRDWRMLSQVAGVYLYFEEKGEGLQPVEDLHPAYIGEDLPALLKYKGKTNEVFTDALITMALSQSSFASIHDGQLTVLDPLCGKGTTLYLALRRGYHGIGIELSRSDVREASEYLTRYLEFHRIKHKKQDFSLTAGGRAAGKETRWILSDSAEHYRDGDTRTLRMIQGDTRDCGKMLRSASAHLLVTDLPYGVQKGTSGRDAGILQTVEQALPGWTNVLMEGGGLAISFNTHVTRRQALEQLLVRHGYRIATPPESCEHWVEQAITRDVVLARLDRKGSAHAE